ncbi:MAG: hypothetical protein LBS12_01460 [Prevotellaceae bacterium]|jgi:hypothetical protein|nr:hypothetical protein [Prevotellaceae bacterium]
MGVLGRILIVFVGILLPCGAAAQYGVERLRETELWSGSENAAWLQALPDLRRSVVEAFLRRGTGAFVDYAASDNAMEAGAGAESYYRLNPRVAFHGKVEYRYFSGQNMGGSAWIDPHTAPFDLVEAADTNRGVKHLEQYRLTGAMSVNVWRGLSLGGRIDYRAAGYAKTRDLRHINKYSDIAFSAGVHYAFGEHAEAGINGFYRHSAEDISFDRYGTTDRQYTSLVSFGGFFGRTELFSTLGRGYTIDANPLFDSYRGAAAQAVWRFAAGWQLFVEAGGRRRSGQYGKRSTTTAVFTEHEGDEYALTGTLSFRRPHAHHLLKAEGRQASLKNSENVFREETTTGNRSEIVYYGQNLVRDALQQHARLAYTGSFGPDNDRPRWRVEAGTGYVRSRQTVAQYPYYRRQSAYCYDLFLSASRTVEWQQYDLRLTLGGACASGGGNPKDDGTYLPPSATQKPPKNFDGYLYRQFDYLTATRAGGNIETAVARRFRSGTQASLALRYEIAHALQPVRIPGNAFHFVSLSLRYEL